MNDKRHAMVFCNHANEVPSGECSCKDNCACKLTMCKTINTKPSVGKIRQFDTGATRDSDTDKLEYNGFNCPLVEKRFAQYMHTHRVQPDGALRASDNWKKGMPQDAYKHSMHRHFMDLWLHLDGHPEEAVDKDLESVLCALRFNVNGMLHELLKAKKSSTLPVRDDATTFEHSVENRPRCV